MSDFRKLIVWQKAMLLARLIYLFTEKLPNEERFGLISQIRRCAVSTPSNIAEGSKRRTKKDFNQFLRIASGSLAELETQILLVKDIYKKEDSEVNLLLKEVQRMLESLIKKL
ncbi:four helix bundle protein [Candidatus Campbellbacteria bacterium RIFOXYC2_FULL_35_25]|uniref:Four helix bundle protein n=1 Tax=Candidatus Campbellbacteria bacterium RIFOXYC2_FULL_35_25 TaxID=1797582 RepID=A0A1F5EHZ9_9BACT|nr:MAG: four helix bundle protein [Candidatus Campbellbacteria bacterium RIFOXYC2_FULL_35_25]